MTDGAAGGRRANRLAGETSPYLLQHAYNPVDWRPWGEEAFETARRTDRPIFLSIGYSSCHWCHVMERESFENEEIARVLNEGFVSIKVDREERPDVDDVYMSAVQLTVGRGGWPLSAFLLPDGRPFFGGTYFPPHDRGGRAGFLTLLTRLAEAYRDRRAELVETAERIVEELRDQSRLSDRFARVPLGTPLLSALTDALAKGYDARHGGFGSAPKFPPHGALDWLLRAAAGDEPDGAGGDAAERRATARSIALGTLDAMALGGIRDHVGGGFHRYSTDERWLLPHFEKMLTDNAQLLGVYARAFALSGRELFRRVARETGDYLLREMRGAEGGFFSATDADSEGEEGKFFVWSFEELQRALGEDAPFFAALYEARPDGNFHDEATGRKTPLNILHLGEEPTEEDQRRAAPLLSILKALRDGRVPPLLDDKRIAGWNALAVSGFAAAAKAFAEPRYLAAARETAVFLLTTLRDAEGRLQRTWKDGVGKIPAFLEDEAYLANALLDLAEVDGERGAAWLAEAGRAVSGMRARFGGARGFTFTGEGHEALVAEGRDLFDKATPSASAAAARALIRLALATGDRPLAEEARAALEAASGLLARVPHGTETWHLALADLLRFEERYGRAAARGAPAAPAAHAGGAGAEGRVFVRGSVSPERARRGDDVRATLAIDVAEGFHLAGEDGLAVEAWAGKDVEVAGVELPPAAPIALEDGTVDLGRRGALTATVALRLAPSALAGERLLSVVVRFRACGGGVCEPPRSVSLALPFTVS